MTNKEANLPYTEIMGAFEEWDGDAKQKVGEIEADLMGCKWQTFLFAFPASVFLSAQVLKLYHNMRVAREPLERSRR